MMSLIVVPSSPVEEAAECFMTSANGERPKYHCQSQSVGDCVVFKTKKAPSTPALETAEPTGFHSTGHIDQEDKNTFDTPDDLSSNTSSEVSPILEDDDRPFPVSSTPRKALEYCIKYLHLPAETSLEDMCPIFEGIRHRLADHIENGTMPVSKHFCNARTIDREKVHAVLASPRRRIENIILAVAISDLESSGIEGYGTSRGSLRDGEPAGICSGLNGIIQSITSSSDEEDALPYAPKDSSPLRSSLTYIDNE